MRVGEPDIGGLSGTVGSYSVMDNRRTSMAKTRLSRADQPLYDLGLNTERLSVPVVNVTENVTTGRGRRVSADFRGGIVYRATATSFCADAIVLTGLRVCSASSRRHAGRFPASARRWFRRVGRARRHGAADSRASFVEAEHGRVKSASQTVPQCGL